MREHWAIGNRPHHVLDVTLAEDASRVRRNRGILAGLRHLGLNLMCSNGESNISQALSRNSPNLDRVLQYAGVWEQ